MAELEGPVWIISPHFDDAVMSCGQLMTELRDFVVLTVFGGGPRSWKAHREWDHDLSGFPEGEDVIAARIKEDALAVTSLGGTPKHLSFRDEMYRRRGTRLRAKKLGEAIAKAISEGHGRTVLVPLGLAHPDHFLTAVGCRYVLRHLRHLRWIAYQELPYAYEPEVLGARGVEEALEEYAPWRPHEIFLGRGLDLAPKKQALEHYASQMRALGQRRAGALEPERYWALSTTSPLSAWSERRLRWTRRIRRRRS